MSGTTDSRENRRAAPTRRGRAGCISTPGTAFGNAVASTSDAARASGVLSPVIRDKRRGAVIPRRSRLLVGLTPLKSGPAATIDRKTLHHVETVLAEVSLTEDAVSRSR